MNQHLNTDTTRGREVDRVQLGNVELDTIETASQEARNLPPGACGATFDRAPIAARNARTLAPCHLKRGHDGSHENDRGVSWTSRKTARTETRRTTTMSSTADLKARTKQMASLMNRRSEPSSIPVYARREAAGPLKAARRAIDLAKDAPSGGFLPSQIATGLRELERVGTAVLRMAADDDTMTTYRAPQLACLRQKLAEAHAVTMPGYTGPALQQRHLEGLRTALDALLTPLEARQQEHERWQRRLAAGAEAVKRPRPAPEPHPWDVSGDAA
jgi:hypothetical protein